MKKYQKIKKSAFLFLVCFLGGHMLLAQQKANVLIFLVDDLRPELGCYGNEIIQSPHIDKLASTGVKFNSAYAQQAICAPSRMSILTGLRPETIGIYDIFTPLRNVHPDMLTMPQYFKNNGYTTVSVGKVYHHGRDDMENWNVYFPKEENSYINPENIQILNDLKEKGDQNPRGPAFESADVEDEAYKDGRVASNVIETLHKLKDENFMMFVGLSKPHLPFNAPKKYWDLYDKQSFEVPSRDKPDNMYALALTQWNELRGYHGIPKEGDLDDDLTRDLIHGYYASVSYIDAQVGKVMETLDNLNLTDNTLVVFMSDHGYKIGEYGAWCKHTNFEIDLKVPLIISAGKNLGFDSKISSNALVENVDIFATAVEACGLPMPKTDGQSLIPFLKSTQIAEKKAAYSLYPRGNKIMGCTVTDGKWRYTEWRNSDTQEVTSRELYRVDDKVSSENFAPTDQYQEVGHEMAQLLEQRFPRDRASFNR